MFPPTDTFNSLLGPQIVVVAAIRDADYGGVAVDSIVLSPECRLSSGETKHHGRSKYVAPYCTSGGVSVSGGSVCAVNDSFIAKLPEPPGEPCTQPDKMCDFNPDCGDGQDEAKCGE